MADFTFTRAFKGDFENPEIVDHVFDLGGFISEMKDYEFEWEHKEDGEDYIGVLTFNELKIQISLLQVHYLKVNFFSASFPDSELRNECLQFSENNLPIYSYQELLGIAIENKENDSPWLAILVKGSVNDNHVSEDVLDLVKQALHSEREEVRKWAIKAAAENSAYWNKLQEEIIRLINEDVSEDEKLTAKQLLEKMKK